MKKYVLIFTNDLHNSDNIHGRVQTQIFNTHEQAYEQMKAHALMCVEGSLKELLLSGIEFSNVYLGEDVARINKDSGAINYYWKIIEVVG